MKSKIEKIINNNLNSDFGDIKNNINYENKTMKKRKSVKKIVGFSILGGLLASVLVFSIILGGIFISNNVEYETSFKKIENTYTLNENKQIQTNTYRMLNNVIYPTTKGTKETFLVDEDYANAIASFANDINKKIDFEKENIIYSPLSLYFNLDILSSLTNVESISKDFNTFLKIDKSSRDTNYINTFKNNFYLLNNATTQMYNGYFTSNKYNLKEEYVDILTSKYTEAYSLDLQSDEDVKKMLSWIDNKLDTENMVDKNELSIDKYSLSFLYSLLYYKNERNTNFSPEDTYKDSFFTLGNGEIEKEFIKHTYEGQIYDYGKYISFYDYYKNGYKIKYIVTKDNNDNIYDLIKDTNIFLKNDEAYMIKSEDEYNEYNLMRIKLSLPKFKLNYKIDFTNLLKDSELSSIFSGKVFNNAYELTDYQNNVTNMYITKVFQKNEIEFNEDGTIAKTVTVSSMAADSSVMPIITDTYEIKLNSSFIYIIEDSNNLPLYVGSYNG